MLDMSWSGRSVSSDAKQKRGWSFAIWSTIAEIASVGNSPLHEVRAVAIRAAKTILIGLTPESIRAAKRRRLECTVRCVSKRYAVLHDECSQPKQDKGGPIENLVLAG